MKKTSGIHMQFLRDRGWLLLPLLLNILFLILFPGGGVLTAALCNMVLWCLGAALLFYRDKKEKRANSDLTRWISQEMGIQVQDLRPESFRALLEGYAARIYEMEILKNKAENDHLQSQINPHFLYNTLDAIRGRATVDGAFEVAQMIETLSRMFRYSISEKSGLLTLEDELSNVEDFLSIQRCRFGDRFDVRYDIDTSDIRVLYYRVPKLILQPLVENAIQHGLEDMPAGGLITIRVYHTNSRLFISVEDNGKGASAEKIQALNRRLEMETEEDSRPDRHGIALVNIQKRIRFQFGKEYGLHLLRNADKGICVELELPWEENHDT